MTRFPSFQLIDKVGKLFKTDTTIGYVNKTAKKNYECLRKNGTVELLITETTVVYLRKGLCNY